DSAYKGVTWSSSNASVAAVSSAGVVTGIGVGTATITAASACDASVKGTLSVTITNPTITLDSSSYIFRTMGSTKTYTFTITPSNYTPSSVTWSSGDSSVVSIDANGVATAKGAGSTFITLKVDGVVATSVAIVIDSSSGLSYSEQVTTVSNGYTSDEYQLVGYKIKDDGGIDIIGRGNTGDSFSNSTYDNGGWLWNINGTMVSLDSGGKATNDGLQLLISPIVARESNVSYVMLYQVLTNMTTTTKTGVKFAAGADVQIGSNDAAPIYKKDYGVSMTDGSLYFNLYCKTGVGVTPVSTVFAGDYSGYTDNYYTNQWADYNSDDSAMCYSWQNLTIEPGESVIKCVRMTLTASAN
ncbi:MAG TPA: hypothetical protein DCO86_05580, partial [Spirochaetaceae bacterium]|nr:hypothetical protein [Spirochaetaceae bacterium]